MNDKPISMVINELKKDLMERITKASLPPCIVEPILKDMYEDVHALSVRQLMEDQKAYDEKQKEIEKQEKENQETVEN